MPPAEWGIPWRTTHRMPEAWLRTNLRLAWSGIILAGCGSLAGALVGAGACGHVSQVWVRSIGWVIAAAGALLTATCIWQSIVPRVGYKDGRLLLNVRLGPSIRIPLNVVEGFLLGQGETSFAHRDKAGSE